MQKSLITSFFLLVFAPCILHAQEQIFDSDELLEIEIQVDMDELQADRGDEVSYHSAVLVYYLGDSLVSLDAEVRARGHFRRQPQICELPPLKLKLGKKAARGTLFENDREIKMVNTCREEILVKREYMLYKVYQFMTDVSLKVRPVMLKYRDTKRPDSVLQRFGFFLEHQDVFQKRMECTEMEGAKLKRADIKPDDLALLALFNYLIGNTDWDVMLEKNLRLFQKEGARYPMVVPYDFDWSGAVGASYTGLAEDYERRKLKSGCLPKKLFQRWISHVLIREDMVSELYKSCRFMTGKERREAVKYLKDSFRIIEQDPFMRLVEEQCAD